MTNTYETGIEQPLTKTEVLEALAQFAEDAPIFRERYDDDGLYALDVEVKGENDGETTRFEYIRAGEFPNNEAAEETHIARVLYENGVPVSAEKVAVYRPAAGGWQAVG